MPCSPEHTLGAIVAEHPASAVVLHRHRLDFCCGGSQTLAAACKARSLDPARIAIEIDAAVEREGSTSQVETWQSRPLEDLINHILTAYHEPLRLELPELIAMAERVERVHALKPACPHGLAAHLRAIHDAVLDHLEKEEQILFPAVLAGQGTACGCPVQLMRHEHDEHGANLQKTRELTNDLIPPEDACTTFRVLYQRLAAMEEDLMRHIHLENHLLFPRALAGEDPRTAGGAA